MGKKKKRIGRIRHYEGYAKNKQERIEQRLKKTSTIQTEQFDPRLLESVEKRLRRVLGTMGKHGKGDKRRGKKK